MRFFIVIIALFCIPFCPCPAKTLADSVRSCEQLLVGNSTNYVLKCPKMHNFGDEWDDSAPVQFFHIENIGDRPIFFLDSIPDDTDFIYINFVTDLPDARYNGQACYRRITEKDRIRDGFYAIEKCEAVRPDSYL